MRMAWPVESTFELLRADAPDELTPGDSLARMRASLRLLPPGSSSYFLECRLGKEDDRVDFGACFRSPMDSADSEESGQGRLPPFTAKPPPGKAWKSVDKAFALWASRKAGLRSRVPFVWVEMDQPGPHQDSASPGLLFCVDPSLARVPARFGAGTDRAS